MISYLLQDEVPLEDISEYVMGRERWKYHKRPLKPMLVDNDERFELAQDNNPQGELDEYPALNQNQDGVAVASGWRTVACQTIFRDNETQTDPYSPEVQFDKDNPPEVLILKNHTYGNGLPATMEEMYFIEDEREQTAFRGALPPQSDEASFKLRSRLMESQEKREWAKRLIEIKKKQNEQLNLHQSALIEREKDIEEYGARRIEAIRAKKTEGKNRLIAKIQRSKIKKLRKIMKAKKQMEKDPLKRDIVEEYHNFASRVYANITREGLSLDKLSNKFEVQPFSLQSYETFEELVMKIKPKYLHNTFDFKQFQRDLQEKHKKLETIHMQALKKAMEQQESAKLKMKQDELRRQEERKRQELAAQAEALRNQDTEHDKHERELAKREAESAAAANKNKWNEAREEAIILFQRLILGRALQNVMFEGKEKRLALIEELLVVSNIKELDKAKEQELLIEQHQQRVKNAFLEALQGETISETLEGLSMELLRFKEEKKVAEFVKKAEDERRKREAEETGRRQAELTLRKREDVLYGEIMKVHQGTVDSYLRKVFTRSIDHLATKQALTLTKLHQDKVQGVVKDTKRQEVLIKDMVTSLLVPNIDRMKLARKVNLEQQRYNVAVRETLDQAFKEANSKLK